MREAVAAWRNGAGVSRVLARARLVMKAAASSLQRPPTSMPRTTRRHLELRTSSGQVRSLALRASWSAAAAKRPARRRGSPARVSEETRVVSTAILGRVEPFVGAAQPGEQHGFRSGRRIDEHLVTANLVIDKSWSVNMPIWMISLDLSKAFDRVHWPSVWRALSQQGFSDHMI